MDVIAGLDVKPWMSSAPIAHDWVTYNGADNRGELVGQPLSRL